ncbi:hypothetical protein LX15_005191 [Streptoalloteichus tenebrarius]|uniref:Uncharacterized protein n=1 Tax=Streptoalloteichus tenebrarius (strain ATCC 17920 / DSM 40477 / JCM 4838 / CBS 697.72 / NBRC 16177 / NCIMB 11028 / NRRL B-12390 / A12253. 1 / ISP 5477) TaxID=1933 RepID=A0ABT1I121_STRSD|nr:hypothetical protein [Streptoalloteichus tenebrarius]MCP2261465.1 hypothetical protein [Streptoalloteichus tenebrarius]BFE99701.1 hypothetical protein GCM10020241_13770 [Streptoalloteichus tenebrarius]
MGGVIIYEPEPGSPLRDLPWIVTFRSWDDSWDPFVCGPYERTHAIGLAEAVAVDSEDVLADVEPLLPAVSPEDVMADIAELRAAAEAEATTVSPNGEGDEEPEDLVPAETPLPEPEEIRAGMGRVLRRLLAEDQDNQDNQDNTVDTDDTGDDAPGNTGGGGSGDGPAR